MYVCAFVFTLNRGYEPFERDMPENISQLSTEGYEKVGVDVVPNFIYLSSECYVISMETDEFQTYSIKKGVEKSTDSRINIHDIMKIIFDNFGIDVLMVRIDSVEEGIYFSKIFLKQKNRILALDSKPSDAIAVAVRADSPIYVKKDILERYGRRVC